MSSKFTPPTIGIEISLKSGHMLGGEVWRDDFEMFCDMWDAVEPNAPQNLALTSVLGDTMRIPSDMIAYVHDHDPQAVEYIEEDSYYDDDY